MSTHVHVHSNGDTAGAGESVAECLEKLLVDPMPDYLRCPICLGLLDTAVIINGCQHCFCQGCATVWLGKRSICPCCREPTLESDLKPARLQRELVACAAVRCHNHSSGCTVITNVASLQDHQRGCDYRPTKCEHEGCTVTGTAIEMQAHQVECTWRPAACESCGLTFVGKVEEHNCLASLRQFVAETDGRVKARVDSTVKRLQLELAETKFRLATVQAGASVHTQCLQDVARALHGLAVHHRENGNLPLTKSVRFNVSEPEGTEEGPSSSSSATSVNRAFYTPNEIAALVQQIQLSAHNPVLDPPVYIPAATVKLYTVCIPTSMLVSPSPTATESSCKLGVLAQILRSATATDGCAVVIFSNAASEAQVIASKLPQRVAEGFPRQRPPQVTVVCPQSALGSPGSAALQRRVAAITAGQIVVSAGPLDTSQDFNCNVDRILVVNFGLPVNADSFYERIPQQALHKGTPMVVVTLVRDSDEAEFVQHTEQHLRRPLQRLRTSDVGSIAF